MSLTDRIERLMVERKLAAGDRLPPERALAAELGVSRSRLREAIQQLVSRGLVSSRRGGGTFVTVAAAAHSLEKAFKPLVPLVRAEAAYWRDVMEIRKSLDTDAAYHAALRATEADRQRLRAALKAMAEAGSDPASQARADAAFHMAIAEASQNVVLRQVVAGLSELLQQSIADSLLRLYRQPGIAGALERQHGLIAEAILNGRAAEARQAVADHLAFVEDSLRTIEDGLAREKRASAAMQNKQFQEDTQP